MEASMEYRDAIERIESYRLRGDIAKATGVIGVSSTIYQTARKKAELNNWQILTGAERLVVMGMLRTIRRREEELLLI